jgi:hypothetical protein
MRALLDTATAGRLKAELHTLQDRENFVFV